MGRRPSNLGNRFSDSLYGRREQPRYHITGEESFNMSTVKQDPSYPDKKSEMAHAKPERNKGSGGETPYSNNLQAQRNSEENSEADWVSIAEELDSQYLLRQQPLRRTHVGFSVTDALAYGGPNFDPNKMAKWLIEEMKDIQPAGYSYAIVRFGNLIDACGVGYARTPAEDNSLEMGVNTSLVSASLAKPLCAVAVMKLVEEKKIALDEKAYPYIQQAFPDVHNSIKDITIYQLVTHTSGLGGGNKAFLRSHSEFSDLLKTSVAPTASSSYHNGNYWFLAHVVEGVTGGGYIDFARKEVLEPMTITEMSNLVESSPCLYYKLGEFTDGHAFKDFSSSANGAYGWFASAIHWAKFMAYFRYDKVLSSETRIQMLTDPKTFFGFRRWFGQPRGTYYGHGGTFRQYIDGAPGDKGFKGAMMGFPDSVDAVLLVNNLIQDPASLLIKAYHAGYA
jgi:CubicO group peptidase (beta-lactamase class C family)